VDWKAQPHSYQLRRPPDRRNPAVAKNAEKGVKTFYRSAANRPVRF
jgi:hypothetical protein